MKTLTIKKMFVLFSLFFIQPTATEIQQKRTSVQTVNEIRLEPRELRMQKVKIELLAIDISILHREIENKIYK